MKVVTFGFHDNEIAYYRHREPIWEMERQGLIEYRSSPDMSIPKISPFPDTTPEQAAENRKMMEHYAEWGDLLFCERYVLPAEAETVRMVEQHRGIPWVLDLDDHVLELDRHNPAFNAYRNKLPAEIGDVREIKDVSEVGPQELCFQHSKGKLVAVSPKEHYHRGLTFAQIMAADALIVPNRPMRNYYYNLRRAEHPRDRIYVIPYMIDPRRWANLKQPPDHSPEVWLGWLGAGQHFGDIEILEPVIEHVLEEYDHVRFFQRLLPGECLSPKAQRLQKAHPERYVIFRNWVDHDKWPQYFVSSAFDIILAPLRDTQFNRCRSPMKWMEAAICGKPCVSSRTFGYVDAIHNRKDGFLCGRPKHWVRAVDELIGSKELRANVGAAARERVLDEYNLEKNAHLWADAFKDVLANLGGRCRERAREAAVA